MKNRNTYFVLTICFFLILACGGGGGGSESLPPPAAPQKVISSNANTQAILSWEKVNGATEYRIYWSNKAGVSIETGSMIPRVSSPYAHIGLTNGVTYYYIVTAVNQNGESVQSKEVSATPSPATPPLPPASVAIHAGNKAVNIAWSESQSEEAVTSYNIYWSVSSGVTKENGIKIIGVSNPYIHTNLINDTTYYYVVTGVNKYGEGNASQEVFGTPKRGNVPLAPTGLTATVGTGNDQVTINWNDSVGATSYNIYWSTSSEISSQNGTKIQDVKSPYSHAGLAEDTTYFYVVTAVNGYGESDDSAKASASVVSNRQDIFVAMGDSITVGDSADTYDDTYVVRLSRTWGKTAVNEGVGGTWSSYGVSIILRILRDHNPKYLTIHYGTNDVGFINNEEIVHNLWAICQTAKENGTIPVVATIGPFFGQWAWRKPATADLNERIRKMAAELGFRCADVATALNWNSAYMDADGLHPNSTGHRIIANTFYNALTR
jgi:lysophospholipase L1-like esterase